MITLDTPTRSLMAVLAAAVVTTAPTALVCFNDEVGNYPGGLQPAQLSNVAVQILAAPANGIRRNANTLFICNTDSIAHTVTVLLDDNGTLYTAWRAVLDPGDKLAYAHGSNWQTVAADGSLKGSGGGGGGTVSAVIGLGVVDVIDASTTPQISIVEDATHRFATDAEKTTWNGKQPALGFTPVPDTRTVNGHALNADVTVTAADAGAIALTALDNDPTLAGNNAARVPSQQAVLAFVLQKIADLVATSPAALDTLKELADALGDDPNFAATMATSLGNRLRVDTAAQGLTGLQQGNARTNLALGNAATKDVGTIAGTVAAGDDARMTNARTPLAHKVSHSTGGTDALTPANIGAIATGGLKTINGNGLEGAGDIVVSATPGGSSGQLEWNNAGAFAGTAAITTNGTDLTLAGGKVKVTSGNASGISFGSTTADIHLVQGTVAGTSDGVLLVLDGTNGTFERIRARAYCMELGANGGLHIASNFASTNPTIGFPYIGNGASLIRADQGVYMDWECQNLFLGGFARLKTYTVATLPSAATAGANALAGASDLSSLVNGGVATAGGALKGVVKSDGSSWIVLG